MDEAVAILDSQFDSLTRWAKVALAARCAHRCFPLVLCRPSSVPSAARYIITTINASTSLLHPDQIGDTVLDDHLFRIPPELANSDTDFDNLEFTKEEADKFHSLALPNSAYLSAFFAIQTLLPNKEPDHLGRMTRMALHSCMMAAQYSAPTPQYRHLTNKAVFDDLLHLKWLIDDGKLAPDAPVPQSTFGPFWRAEEPDWWQPLTYDDLALFASQDD